MHYLSDPGYTHRYTVDLTATLADAYVRTESFGSTSWKTILVGGLRSGGRGLYALDVTDPTTISETSAAAANTVLWEFNSGDDIDLGFTFSRPSIVPLEAPGNTIRWAAIFGNGYNDLGSGEAVLYIVLLEGGLDGTWSYGTDYIKISTGVGSAADRNGLASPAIVDTDGDGLADRAYAGDLEGNMWAFDLSGSNANNWDVAFKSGSTPVPLYNGTAGQPITASPVIVRNNSLATTSIDCTPVVVMSATVRYWPVPKITSVFGKFELVVASELLRT
ncbi:MAG: PilC/PilY family type IV pilus protein, partial [Pseudomonadota bacterium]